MDVRLKKYPKSVMKGLLTVLLFVMVAVTILGFIITAVAFAGEVYSTSKEDVWIPISNDLRYSMRYWSAVDVICHIAYIVVGIVYSLRYAAPVIMIAGLLLTVLLFCLLMRAAGHKKGAQEITLSKFDRFLFELVAGIMIGIPVLIHWGVYLLTSGTVPGNWFFNADPVEIPMFILLLSPFVYALCHTFTVRLKSRTLWESTLLYRIFWKLPKRLIRSVKNAGKTDENGGVVPQWYDKIPLEIVAAVLLILPLPLYVGIHDTFRYTLLWTIMFDWVITAFLIAGAAIVALLYLFAYTVSVRYKCGTLWTNTLTYRLGRLLKKLFRHLNHAGKRNESGEVVSTWFDKIPLEIIVLALIPIGFLAVLFSAVLGDLTDSSLSYISIILLAAAILYGFAYAVSVRIQLGTLWTNTIVYRLRPKLSGIFPHLCRSIPLTWRTILGIALYLIVTYIMLQEIRPRNAGTIWFMIWFIVTIVLSILLIYSAWATHRIHDIIRDMAGGKIDLKTDTSRFFFIFKQQADGLNSLSDGLQAAVQARMKSERFKTELITNVSHDIKTPLTSIINYSDLLLAEKPDGKAGEYADVIYRHSLRLKKLTEDLLEASKASSGTINVEFERLELNQMLRQAVGEYEERLNRAGLTPVFRFTNEDVYLSADGKLLWRVFDNLLSNIVKYSLPGTRVYVTLTKMNGQAVVSFKNISRETLEMDTEELLERFVRGDASRHSEGSGLGLNIAQSLCGLMHGKMDLACDGDLFRADVTFPVIE